MLEEICNLNKLLETANKTLAIAESKVEDLREEVKCNREQEWEEVVKPILVEMQHIWAQVPDAKTLFSPAIKLHDVYSGGEMLDIRFGPNKHFLLSGHAVANDASFSGIKDDSKVLLLIDRWGDFEDEIINGMSCIVKKWLKYKADKVNKEYSELRQKLGFCD